MRVVVSNVGVHPELAMVAAELGRTRGIDLRYYTASSLPSDSRVLALTRLLLPRGSSLRQTVGRRQLPTGLDRRHVRTLGATYELLYLLLRPRRTVLADRVLRVRTRVFDQHVSRQIRARMPDVVIAQSTGAARTLRAARMAGTLTILNAPIAHPAASTRILRDEARRNPDWAGTFTTPDVPSGRSELDSADFVFGGGNFTRRTYVEETGLDATTFKIVPLGVDTDLFTPGERSRDGVFRVIFVGQLSQRKGLKYLVDAFERLDLPQAKELLLVGPAIGNVRSVLPQRSWLRVSNSVPRLRLPDLYRQSDAFVLPSLVEGFAQTPLEAMACGLPVLVTPNNGVTDIVSPGVDAEVIGIQDTDAIERTLQRWAADPAGRAAMGAAARQTAMRHTWSIFAQRYATEVLRCATSG